MQKPLTKYRTSMTLTYNVSENEARKLIPFDDALTKKPITLFFFYRFQTTFKIYC